MKQLVFGHEGFRKNYLDGFTCYANAEDLRIMCVVSNEYIEDFIEANFQEELQEAFNPNENFNYVKIRSDLQLKYDRDGVNEEGKIVI